MITGKEILVTYTQEGKTDSITLVITAQQIESTARRRMNTLLPNARVIDMTEKVVDAAQLDMTAARRKK